MALVTGTSAACESAEAVDTNPRMFIAVDMPPLNSDRASTGGISFTDYDGDGDLDILIGNWSSGHSQTILKPPINQGLNVR